MKDAKYLVIELIVAVLKGEISDAYEFARHIENLPNYPKDSTIAIALHQANHYLADTDIFSKDPAYHQLQRKELSELLENLKAQ